jgi:hypothetical protein
MGIQWKNKWETRWSRNDNLGDVLVQVLGDEGLPVDIRPRKLRREVRSGDVGARQGQHVIVVNLISHTW